MAKLLEAEYREPLEAPRSRVDAAMEGTAFVGYMQEVADCARG